MNCLKCKHDLSEFAQLEYMYLIIECPNCGNEMEVDYDDADCDDDSYGIFSLIQKED